ncbi:hypothetical protein AVEN_202087-1, partial [Araneus ventricosus]
LAKGMENHDQSLKGGLPGHSRPSSGQRQSVPQGNTYRMRRNLRSTGKLGMPLMVVTQSGAAHVSHDQSLSPRNYRRCTVGLLAQQCSQRYGTAG